MNAETLDLICWSGCTARVLRAVLEHLTVWDCPHCRATMIDVGAAETREDWKRRLNRGAAP